MFFLPYVQEILGRELAIFRMTSMSPCIETHARSGNLMADNMEHGRGEGRGETKASTGKEDDHKVFFEEDVSVRKRTGLAIPYVPFSVCLVVVSEEFMLGSVNMCHIAHWR